MYKKIAAFLTAVSVLAGVCVPAGAESSEPVYMEIAYEDTADTVQDADAAADEAGEEEATVEEAEDDVPADEDGNTEETSSVDEIPAESAPAEAAAQTSDVVAVDHYDMYGNYVETVYEEQTAEENSDLLRDEALYLAAGWASWDASTGTLTLKGQLPNTYWDNGKPYDIAKISGIDTLDVKKIIISSGTTAGTSTSQMFRGMNNLTQIVGLSNLDTSEVTDMTGMFVDCTSLKRADLSGIDTSKVKEMGGMFNNCRSLVYLDLSGFDTARVTDMGYMFNNCMHLETIVVTDKFRTSAVKSTESMFFGCLKIVGGEGTTYDNDCTSILYARIDKGASRKGYFTAAVAQPTVVIKPVFGGRTITFRCADSDAKIYYNFGSSYISTSCKSVNAGETVFVDEALWGDRAAMFFRAYKNGKWSELSKWGVLNVQLDRPIIVQSGKQTDNRVKIYTQAKDSYIVYTTDGSIPAVTEGTNRLIVKNGTVIWGTSGFVSVPRGRTVRAIAIRCGLVTSYVTSYSNSY